MKDRAWIDDEAAARAESELAAAFGMSGAVIEERKFKLIRQELYSYFPDDLLGALPYVLMGFLRFGVRDDQDWADLVVVIQFLNIKCHPYDDPNTGSGWEEMQRIGRSKETTVSGFSNDQAQAIRLWLEAVRDCSVLIDDVAQEELGHAIAYWDKGQGDKGSLRRF